MKPLTGEEFRRLFDTCRSAFRLEVLQVYDVPEEAEDLRAWREGRPLPPDPWAQHVHDSDATLQRVHVVREPLTPYLRYEIERYRGSVQAGEDVRIAVLNHHPELTQLTQDWWGFDLDSDQPIIALMRYDTTGHWHGADEDRDSAHIAQRRHERDLALSCSVLLRDYLTSISAGA